MALFRLLSRFSLPCLARLQMRVRKWSHVSTKPASTWTVAKIFLLGDPISSVDAVSELLRSLVNWARTTNYFVSRRALAILSKCASS